MTNRSLRFAAGISSISALALVMVACGGSSSSSPAVATAQPPSTPVITGGPTAAVTKHVYTYNLSATDPQGDALTFQLSTPVDGATISGNVLTYKPTAAGNVTLSVVAKNAHNLTSTIPAAYPVAVTANRGPVFTTTEPSYTLTGSSFSIPSNTTLQVNAIDPDGDNVTYALSGLKVYDNLGTDITASTDAKALIDAKGVVTFSGTVPNGFVGLTFKFNVTATDLVPNGTGDSSAAQAFVVNYTVNNQPPVILTTSLPTLAANHYIPSATTDIDPKAWQHFELDGADVDATDTLTWTLLNNSSKVFKLVDASGKPASTGSTVYLASDTGFAPLAAGSYQVQVQLSDSHNAPVVKYFTIPVTGGAQLAQNTTPFTEVVSGVVAFNKADVKGQILAGPDADHIRAYFNPGGAESLNWFSKSLYSVTPYVNTADEADFTAPDSHTLNNLGFSNYTDTFLGHLSNDTLADTGWNTRALFTPAVAGDKVVYDIQPGSVYVSSPLNPVGQPFVPKAGVYPLFAYGPFYVSPDDSEYPAIDSGDPTDPSSKGPGTIQWRPIMPESLDLSNISSNYIGDDFGYALFTNPTIWSFTVEAKQKIWNPVTNKLVDGSATGKLDYTVKVQPNNVPRIGELTTIDGKVYETTTHPADVVVSNVAIGGGTNVTTKPGRPSIQEPASTPYDVTTTTAFPYDQANSTTAKWRWAVATPGGLNPGHGGYTEDVEIYDPDYTVGTGHQDSIAMTMGTVTYPAADPGTNLPVLDSKNTNFYNPWSNLSLHPGNFQVNWGPSRSQYLIARVTNAAAYKFPVEVRDQYERIAKAELGINPIFGTVRFANARTRILFDQAAAGETADARGTFLTSANEGDPVVNAAKFAGARYTFTYLPMADLEKFPNIGSKLFSGTGPASGIDAAGHYRSASWITLNSVEASPRTLGIPAGYHTGNPLNDEATTFNLPSYAAGIPGTGKTAAADWRTYSLDKSGSPVVDTATSLAAQGQGNTVVSASGIFADHEARAQVIPSNSPYLFSIRHNGVVTGYGLPATDANYFGNYPNEVQGTTSNMTPVWYNAANVASYNAGGWYYGQRQGEIDYSRAVAGRAVVASTGTPAAHTAQLRWTYTWPTAITVPNLSVDPSKKTTNQYDPGDVMEIAVPNMGANGRFFFTGDAQAQGVPVWGTWGKGGIGSAGTAADTALYIGKATDSVGVTGFTTSADTPFHVVTNSIWVPNTQPNTNPNAAPVMDGTFNLPNSTTFSAGVNETYLPFTGIKGYLASGTGVLDPSNVAVIGGTSNPALINLDAKADRVYFLWLKNDKTLGGSNVQANAWATWGATELVAGSSYTATGGLTTVPGFTMGQAMQDTNAQLSFATKDTPGTNQASNFGLDSAYDGTFNSWQRNQWGLLAPAVASNHIWNGTVIPNARLVNPVVGTLTTNLGGIMAGTTANSFWNSTTVTTDGGIRDSAVIYAVRNRGDLGAAGIEPSSPVLAQWHNIQETGDLALDKSTVYSTKMTDATKASGAAGFPVVFQKFYSPFAGDSQWSHVIELKVNFVAAVMYPMVDAAANTIWKVPATVSQAWPISQTAISYTNPVTGAVSQLDPGRPIVSPARLVRINDYQPNHLPGVQGTMIDLVNSMPQGDMSAMPFVPAGNPTESTVVTIPAGTGNPFLNAYSTVTLTWQSSVNNQVIPSGYIVELYSVPQAAAATTGQPVLLGSFRTGHIGAKEAVQTLNLPSMHSLSGQAIPSNAAYFFKIRTVWYNGVDMEKAPFKQSLPRAMADFVTSTFVAAAN